jgi:hypothetical protein
MGHTLYCHAAIAAMGQPLSESHGTAIFSTFSTTVEKAIEKAWHTRFIRCSRPPIRRII